MDDRELAPEGEKGGDGEPVSRPSRPGRASRAMLPGRAMLPSRASRARLPSRPCCRIGRSRSGLGPPGLSPPVVGRRGHERPAGLPGFHRPCAAPCSWPGRPRSAGSKSIAADAKPSERSSPDKPVSDAATTVTPPAMTATEPPTATEPSPATEPPPAPATSAEAFPVDRPPATPLDASSSRHQNRPIPFGR